MDAYDEVKKNMESGKVDAERIRACKAKFDALKDQFLKEVNSHPEMAIKVLGVHPYTDGNGEYQYSTRHPGKLVGSRSTGEDVGFASTATKFFNAKKGSCR